MRKNILILSVRNNVWKLYWSLISKPAWDACSAGCNNSNVVDLVYHTIIGEVGNCCVTSVQQNITFFISKR